MSDGWVLTNFKKGLTKAFEKTIFAYPFLKNCHRQMESNWLVVEDAREFRASFF